jgi:2-methylcitrate dehydratase PrpD
MKGQHAAVAEQLASLAATVQGDALPPAVRDACRRLVLDVTGLCLAARNADYMRAMLAGLDPAAACTAIGHVQRFTPADAMLINGTAAHGEDYDDTFEGGPVHSGAVIVPAMLAAAERHRLSGADLLAGIAVGSEVTCRLSLVAPKMVHAAGFHPTAVFGAMGAAAAVATALRLSERAFASALGLAGSMASGIIEYLAEGTWTKRMHPGWAAQSGYRAARLAASGFLGPRTVFEGKHGLFHGFARDPACDWSRLLSGFGEAWIMASIAFKPYPCGTMAHPYIDCAIQLRHQGITPEQIAAILCETAEGFVHRLWEPLDAKQSPPNGYAAKFSIPYAVAAAIIHGEAGLSAFEDAAVADERVKALAAKVRYVVDPDHPYPRSYTGHMRVALNDGQVLELRQPHLRGGIAEPLTDAELEAKFRSNAVHGGWDAPRAEAAIGWVNALFDAREVDLLSWRG